MKSLVHRSLIFVLGALSLPALVESGLFWEKAIAVEPLCYMVGNDGHMQDLGDLCAMGDTAPVSVPSQSPAAATVNRSSTTGGAVEVMNCDTAGDEDLRYLRGRVSNETGAPVSNVVVRYQVIEEEDNSRRVGRRSGLRIEEEQLQADASGTFDGTNNKFKVAESLSDAYTEILGVEWRGADGQAGEYRYPTPRVCRWSF